MNTILHFFNWVLSFGIFGYMIIGVVSIPVIALGFKCVEWGIGLFLKSLVYLISVALVLYTVYIVYIAYVAIH
jgi:uncharacterized membrane protein